MELETFTSIFEIPELINGCSSLWQRCKKGEIDVLSDNLDLKMFAGKRSRKSHDQIKKRMFVLNDGYLFCINEKMTKAKSKLRLGLLRVDIIVPEPQTTTHFGILRFLKHDRFSDLYIESKSELELWQKALRPLVVFSDMHRKYSSKGMIAKGGFGKVYKVERKADSKIFAVKAMSKSSLKRNEKGVKMLVDEIEILRRVNHPLIVKLEEVQESENTVYLIMEYFQGAPLMDLHKIQKIPKTERLSIMSQILNAASYLESVGVVHRDIKPDNLLYNKATGEVRMIDFGLSFCKDQNLSKMTRVGTPGFVGPEILRAENIESDSNLFNSKLDVYSCGIIYYCMITGKHPFDGDNCSDVIEKNTIANIDYAKVTKEGVDQVEINFLRSLTSAIPDERISLKQAIVNELITSTLGEFEKDISIKGTLDNESVDSEDYSTNEENEDSLFAKEMIQKLQAYSLKPFKGKIKNTFSKN